jgi:hypothetical protein
MQIIEPLDLSRFAQRAWTVANDIARILQGRLAVVESRSDATKPQLAAYDAASDPPTRTAAAVAAVTALFADDFRIYPEFSLSSAQAGEWTNAVAGSAFGALLFYLKTTGQVDEPVDEWLYGECRARQVMCSTMDCRTSWVRQASTFSPRRYAAPEPCLNRTLQPGG